ncbi:hypothetical protein ABPG72_011825 [Tetrahymena utriculariae]
MYLVRKHCQWLFSVIVVFIIVCIYLVNMILVQLKQEEYGWLRITYLVIYNLLAFMLAWSLLVTMFSDPGRVPQLWGYFLTEQDNKKKIYCLNCHIFKPVRTHHCSTCKRCVLNMDHHCQWINNCVGFANRKFFMLMLFYINITTFFTIIGMIPKIIDIIKIIIYQHDKLYWFTDLLVVFTFCFAVTVLIVIGNFTKVHIDLILVNSTTLENLDRKRQSKNDPNQTPQINIYDMGEYYNWIQVFGSDYWLWPFPIFLKNYGPAGDGILWPSRYEHYISESKNNTQGTNLAAQNSRVTANPQVQSQIKSNQKSDLNQKSTFSSQKVQDSQFNQSSHALVNSNSAQQGGLQQQQFKHEQSYNNGINQSTANTSFKSTQNNMHFQSAYSQQPQRGNQNFYLNNSAVYNNQQQPIAGSYESRLPQNYQLSKY